MTRARLLATILVALAGCGGAQLRASDPARGQGLDPEVARIFAHPYPEGETPVELRFSPDGRLLAYTIFESEAGRARLVLRLVELRSREDRVLWDEAELPPSELEWLPSGEGLLVTAGGDLWLQPARAGAERRRLTSTEGDEASASPSPDGSRVAFVRDHDLWVLALDGSAERRLTEGGTAELLNGEVDWVYEEELDLYRAFWWSPDSSRIAFLQFDESRVQTCPVLRPGDPTARFDLQRYPHAGSTNPTVRLGVVGAALEPAADERVAAELLEPQPRDGYLARVSWTPEGDRLVVVTLDRPQRHLRLVLVDPDGAAAERLLLEERDEAWLNLLDPPRFLGRLGRFLWRSERDGHAHLYLHEDGSAPRQLTSGEWEVSRLVHVDEAAGLVYFEGNREARSRYHLYSVPLSGGEVSRVSRAEGCHEVTFSPDGSRFVDVRSSLAEPPRATVHDRAGEPLFVLAEAALGSVPYLGQAVAELVRVPGQGVELDGLVVRPARLERGRRYPAVVLVYNGPHVQLARDAWRSRQASWTRYLASRGAIVFSLDGRGSAGRGRAWEKAIYRRLGEVELEDQMAGVAYLRSLEHVDPARIAVYGWSYGGTMALHLLLRRPGTFRAGVAVAPVTDWRLYDTIYTERYMTGPADNPDGYRRTALVPLAGALEDPLLLVHGLSDDNVHLENSTLMIEALVNAGRRFEVMVYPGQRHGISSPAARAHVFSTLTRYLLGHLLE